MNKLLIILLLILPVSLSAQELSKKTLGFYILPIVTIENPIDVFAMLGAFFNYKKGAHEGTAAFDFTGRSIPSVTPGPGSQSIFDWSLDFSGQYKWYTKYFSLGATAHYMTGADPQYNNAINGTAVFGFYGIEDLLLKAESNYTYYSGYSNGLSAAQGLIYAGYQFIWMNHFSLSASIEGRYIYNSINCGSGNHLFSGETHLYLGVFNWIIDIYGWYGNRTFSVESEGLVIYNNDSNYKGGFGIKNSIYLSDSWSLQINLQDNIYLNNSAYIHQLKTLIMCKYNF
jgi:hypothetical protein